MRAQVSCVEVYKGLRLFRRQTCLSRGTQFKTEDIGSGLERRPEEIKAEPVLTDGTTTKKMALR